MNTAANQKELFRVCRRLLKAGQNEEAGELLSNALRRNRMDADGVLHAGRVLQRIDRKRGSASHTRITILGQCTTSWLLPALTAVARGRNSRLFVAEADFDNVMQGLNALDSDVQAIVLLPWTQHLLNDSDRSASQRVADEIDFWQNAWALADKSGKRHLVQIGYDWADAGATGHFAGAIDDGDIALVRQTNRLLRECLPKGAYFVDLEQVSGTLGRERFYDARSYHWTKQPFSDAGVVRLAEHLWAGLRAATSGPKKVLVLDLDNTLWGGVVGETGSLGIELSETIAGEAFRNFQHLVKSLAKRGILIAICSKNNPEDAREPFEKNPNMVLGLDDIAVFEAGWASKAEVIRKIAAKLNLDLDSFVFFDDDAAERELMRQALPAVEVVDVPDDPSEYRHALLSGLWFESATHSAEDALRTRQYQAEQLRDDSRSSSPSVEGYLLSLEMTAEVNEIDALSMDRVIQLLAKTNQFNLTTKRHTAAALAGMLERPDAIGMTLRIRDRFGDYGLVGVVVAVNDAPGETTSLRIDTWLMSCRVIGRTAEHFFFNKLIDRLQEGNCTSLLGEYIPTRKNSVVADLYTCLGFKKSKNSSATSHLYELDLDGYEAAPTCIAAATSPA